jgi:hypothetical protein
MTDSQDDWRKMDPWEKARRWQKVSPEITTALVAQAAAHADEQMKIEAEQARHAMRIAEDRTKHDMQLAKESADHIHELNRRHARLQLIGTIGGLACIVGLILVAALYANTGNIVPGLAIFGLGTGLTAGIYGLQWSAARDAKALMQQTASIQSMETAAPPVAP